VKLDRIRSVQLLKALEYRADTRRRLGDPAAIGDADDRTEAAREWTTVGRMMRADALPR
jgi:hypothetical protein